jgi:hypothetical protein
MRTAIVLLDLLCLATSFLVSTARAADDSWQIYIDNTYKVSLRFPGEWKKDPLYYDRPYFGVERHRGSSARGFLQLDAMASESDTPEQACRGEAEHVLKPFGASPSIRSMEVDGRPACLIWPSEDQGAPWDAAVFIKYPQPVEIGGERYNILMLDADRNYILDLVRTIRLENPLFQLEITPRKPEQPVTWKQDNQLSLIVTMKNRSSQVVHLAISNTDFTATTLYKLDPIPVTVALDSQGGTPKSLSTGNTMATIKPDEMLQTTVGVKFAHDREAPGTYTLQLETDLPLEFGKGVVESNTIGVTVIN